MKCLKVVNLKQDMPTVEQARGRLQHELTVARQHRVVALKAIHGYGSHGIGGDLRIAIQAMLASLATAGEIRGFIAGEDWRISNEETWNLLKRFPDLKNDSDLGRGNKGVSIVLL